MGEHRINELIELLQCSWKEQADLSLLQFLNLLAKECGFKGELTELSDDALIYQLKMRGSKSTDEIPGLKKTMKRISKRRFYVPGVLLTIDVNLCELHASG